MKQSIHIGFDPRETDAFAVARRSIQCHLTLPIRVRGLVLSDLIATPRACRLLRAERYRRACDAACRGVGRESG